MTDVVESLRRRDVKSLWHPCTEIDSFERSAFPIIERAKGVYLYEVGGRPLLDGIASWWAVNLGHGHPKLIEAIRRQAGELQHAILGGMSHPNAILLAERLGEISPGHLGHAFFCGDGASAVEAALKIAVQYWANIGQEGRSRFVGLEEGYHGDTLGAMGVGYVESFHHDYRNVVRSAYHALSPHCLQCPCGKSPEKCDVECFASMEKILRSHHRRIAAVIVEPLCQGAAGMRIYPEEYLRRLRKLCDHYRLILIADEIAVGFGRTGHMFACERAGIVPDIMTIGKGITGGYMPLSAALAGDAIYDSFRRRDDGKDRTFWHSHTFGGNPITTALALAALDVYRDERVVENCRERAVQLETGMRRLASLMKDSRFRALGMIGVVEISESSGGAERASRVVAEAYRLGLFLRPRGRAIYLWPPLVSTSEELGRMLEIVEESVKRTQ